MNIFGIILLVLAILSILSIIITIHLKHIDNDNADIVFGCFIGLLSSVHIIFIIVVIANPVSAIEVYRSNTTLQITYKDNIPIDSVVVYKNK